MSILTQLERDLRDASDRLQCSRRRSEVEGAGSTASGAGRPARRARLGALVIVGVLGLSTAALAASGVIRIGSPVPADKRLHRESGLGVPVKSGGTRLLPLRVPDPRGGPPWGMRMVRTSREELCLQIGRVAHGRLGELGIDGAFHDDGELHPRPVSSLPAGQAGGLPAEASNQNTGCVVAGKAVIVADLVVPSSAAAMDLAGGDPMAVLRALPRRDLRNVYYGLLGPQAVSVTYRAGGAEHTQPVAAGSGAYLIVRPLRNGQALRDFGTSSGAPYGQLTPSPGEMIDKVTYRIDGRLCERGLRWQRTPVGAWRPTGTARDVVHPCPESGERRPLARPVGLHRPVHAHIHVRAGVVTGLTVTFRAPYAVRSAREGYSLFLPERRCHPKDGDIEVEGGEGIALDRNIRRSALVSYTLRHHPFARRRLCRPHTLIVEAVYENGEELSRRTIVGEVTVHQPPGTRARP